jgi:DNA-binding NtrC family response regulator
MTASHVLVVDDDPALLQALPEALRLRMAGVTVDTADSGAAALDRIVAREHDAIVIDVKMPGMDGLALLAEIRARRPDTPVLMITGHGEHALAIQALRGGAYDFIQKPIGRDHFVAALSRAIRAHALNRRVKDRQLALERCTSELEQIAGKLGRGSEPARVLIVDDDPALLQALPQALRLRMAEVTVETADSAAAALDRIAARDYDAIVTDIKMPGMDGLALLAEIRRRQPDTPILIITGHGEYDLSVRALRGGAYDFIQKPIDRDHFVALLYRAIRAHAVNRRGRARQLALERCTSELDVIVEKLGRELRGTPLRGEP